MLSSSTEVTVTTSSLLDLRTSAHRRVPGSRCYCLRKFRPLHWKMSVCLSLYLNRPLPQLQPWNQLLRSLAGVVTGFSIDPMSHRDCMQPSITGHPFRHAVPVLVGTLPVISSTLRTSDVDKECRRTTFLCFCHPQGYERWEMANLSSYLSRLIYVQVDDRTHNTTGRGQFGVLISGHYASPLFKCR